MTAAATRAATVSATDTSKTGPGEITAGGTFIAQEWLDYERDVLGHRPVMTGTPEEIRKGYQAASEQLGSHYPPASDYNVQDYKEVTDSGIAIRVYAPREIAGSPKLPLGVFAHGGGHVGGGAWASSFEDRVCRHVVHNTGIIIAQVDFRLAPEAPMPAQLNDCFDAYKWCYENAARLHGDPDRFFAFGSSLGGGVAVGLALKLIDENLAHMVKGVVALVPALLHPEFVPAEYQHLFKAYKETWTGTPLQDGESMLLFYGHNGGTAQRMNPYAFPCLHPGLSQLPPVYQAICEADPVRDDSTVLKHILDKHGVLNKADSYPGMPHYFWIHPLASSMPFHDKVADGVKWLISVMK